MLKTGWKRFHHQTRKW
ncbi:hypothetical protein EYF80_068317 [Liparis tanakae]|uniref:Uncharacterized protein n=1 Tax=Liparis tanakae TaxID=230148 RepID=A0A4Z2DZJ4_9TELE|nr:hypothetical protein EYF80_068317 [Liparis tanakae]